ncbi:MAG: transcriptional regulator PpsR [Pseudomonadota bacterium]
MTEGSTSKVDPDAPLATLDAKVLADALASSSDIQVVIDSTYQVHSAASVDGRCAVLGYINWNGQDFRDFLTVESVPKFEARLRMLEDEDGDAAKRTLELNHALSNGGEVPMQYTLIPTDEADFILLVGRDLRPIAEVQQQLVRAQQALDKDYETYRYADTRYRAVMESSREALVFVDTLRGRIIDLNTAAVQLLGADRDALQGAAFGAQFSESDSTALTSGSEGDDLLKEGGPIEAKTLRGREKVIVNATALRAGGERLILCRLDPLNGAFGREQIVDSALTGIYKRGADAILVTDKKGVVLEANEALLSLCDMNEAADVKGKSFAELLARGGIDMKVLLENAARSGKMRLYTTKVIGRFGSQITVEIAATQLQNGVEGFGFVIRDTSRMESVRDSATPVTDEAMRNVMELVGSAPLRDIVAATTDVVERMCIETAVELTQNNRVAAAEMLGLSRQSLYVKLRKFNLQNKNGPS